MGRAVPIAARQRAATMYFIILKLQDLSEGRAELILCWVDFAEPARFDTVDGWRFPVAMT